MLARRLVIVGFLVAVLVIALRSGTSTPSEATTDSGVADLEIGGDTNETIPMVNSSEPVIAAQAPSSSAEPPTVSTTTVDTQTMASLPAAELSDLVAASRPELPALEVVDDGAQHEHHQPHDTRVAAMASSVVVSLWTWRFDDPDGRTQEQLVGLVYDDVIERIAPSPEQTTALSAAGEVSWAIVRQVTVDGPVVTVIFDHHLVTSTAAELVTLRTATVTFFDGRVIDVSP